MAAPFIPASAAARTRPLRLVERERRREGCRAKAMRDVDPTRPWTQLYPDWVPNELPIPTESMADVLEATARAAGEAPAIHYFDATISYARLDDLASRFATLLASW